MIKLKATRTIRNHKKLSTFKMVKTKPGIMTLKVIINVDMQTITIVISMVDNIIV